MESPRGKSTNLHKKLFCYMLLLIGIINVRAAEIQVQAEVGGNVSIYCPVDPQRKITYFYFQKPVHGSSRDDFVNGFYSERNMSSILKWNNTHLDPHNKTIVHMYNVTLKHAGVYKCIIDGIDPTTTVNLKVTAKYSKPAFIMTNISGLGFCVTCKSYGGYPPAEFTWNISGNEEWRVMTSNTKADKLTELVYTSSTVFINCSGVERSVSCSVGDSTSDTFQVCQPIQPENDIWIIVGCVLGGIFVLGLLVLPVWIIKKKERDRRRSGQGGDGGDGGRQTQNAQEMEPLRTAGNGNV